MRFAALTPVVILAACSASTDEVERAEASADDPALVSRESFDAEGLAWPLTVESGRLGCTKLARWVEADGKKYGLNGLADAQGGYAELEDIWAIDEPMMARLKEVGASGEQTVRISIGDMSNKAEAFCE
ncbi:MAG: hypothetical protein AAF687_01795 [Pseudomonadota bacterium]